MADERLIEMIQMRALTAGTDELYEGIASVLPQDQRDQVVRAAALKLPSPVEIGKAFFERTLLPAIEDTICGKAQFCKNRELYDTATKIASFAADQVGQVIGSRHGVAPETGGNTARLIVETSAAVLKRGLNALCRCSEQ